MSTQTTVINTIESAKETILGMTISIESRFGVTPRNDIGTTLNTKLGVFPSILPAGPVTTKYFCWGVGGRYNDTTGLSSAQSVLGTNMSLYAMRPFRAVPLAQDLTPTDRTSYAMRVVQTIAGVQYALYYLKAIDFSNSQVQYTITDPVSNVVSSYNLNYNNLNPTPPVANSNGVITDISDNISVTLPASIVLTGEEVFESMNVIDGGDTRFSIASEIGFVSASTQSMAGTDISGNSFMYNEAILAQMVQQYDWVGQPFMSTSDSYTRVINFQTASLILP